MNPFPLSLRVASSRAALTMLLFAGAAATMAQPASAPAVSLPAAASPAKFSSPTSRTVQTTATTTLSKPTSGTLAILRGLEAFHKQVQTVHATFHQVRVDEVMTDKVDSDGELWFHKPYLFRCDYRDPRPLVVLILEKTFYTYMPELKQVDFLNFSSPQRREQQLHQLLIGFGFDTDELIRTYVVHSSEGEAEPLKELAKAGLDPKKKVLFIFTPRPEFRDSSPFQTLKLYIDKDSHLPEKIWYEDPNQANMTLTMKAVDTGKPIDDAIFDIKKVFPPGVEMVDRNNAP